MAKFFIKMHEDSKEVSTWREAYSLLKQKAIAFNNYYMFPEETISGGIITGNRPDILDGTYDLSRDPQMEERPGYYPREKPGYYPNIIGTGICIKYKDGWPTNEIALGALVDKKVEHKKLKTDLKVKFSDYLNEDWFRFPVIGPEFQGITTDVQEIGHPRLYSDSFICGGDGIVVRNSKGTIGAVLSSHDGKDVLISAGHVFGRKANDVVKNGRIIAKVQEIYWNSYEGQDFGVAEIIAPTFVHSKIKDIGNITGFKSYKDMNIESRVRKFGATTGITYGDLINQLITSIRLEVAFGLTKLYNDVAGIIHEKTEPQLTSKQRPPFSKEGDSGALVLESFSQYACGMVIGGSESFAVSLIADLTKLRSLANLQITEYSPADQQNIIQSEVVDEQHDPSDPEFSEGIR